jgi:hypothetical protein
MKGHKNVIDCPKNNGLHWITMDYIDTTCFDDIVKAVKSLCGFDDEEHVQAIVMGPSYQPCNISLFIEEL